jgi:hypothetical protein
MLSLNALQERLASTERQMEQLDRDIEPLKIKLALMRDERTRLFTIWARTTNQLKLAESKAANPDYKTKRLFQELEPEDVGGTPTGA